MKKIGKTFYIALLVMLAALTLVEFVFYNRSAIAVRAGSFQRTVLSLSEAVLGGGASRGENGPLLIGKGGEIIFSEIDQKVAYIAVRTKGSTRIGNFSIWMKDESQAKDFVRAGSYCFIPSDEEFQVYRVASKGKLRALKLVFEEDCQDTAVTEVVLNQPVAFGCNIFRLLFLFAVAAAVYLIKKLQLWRAVYDPQKTKHQIALLTMVCLCFLQAIFVGGAADYPELLEYPLRDPVNNHGCYTQLFDAFKKGQLNLDIDYDAAALEALENPYDHAERSEKLGGADKPFWDRAYFEGEFYCYFGAAPVFTIYFPVYLLTGHIPSEGLAILLLSIFAAAFLSLALLRWIRTFCRKAPLLLVILAVPALICGSLVYVLQSCPTFYYIAVLSGITSLAMLFYFSMAACQAAGKRRKLLFVLAGVSVVLTAGSRPNLVLFGFVVLPLFLGVLRDRSISCKNRVKDAAFFLLPVIIGAALLMGYNYGRFGSIFEFGSRYQLTMSDISYNKADFHLFLPALYHYFFQPPIFQGKFPFINLGYTDLGIYGNYLYLYYNIGAFCIPAALGVFGVGAVTCGKENRIKRAVYLLIPCIAILVAFLDICLGGVHFRYTADILFPLIFAGLLVLIEIAGNATAQWEAAGKTFIAVVAVLLIVTIFTGTALIFYNEPHSIYRYSPKIYMFFYRIFI